MIWSTSTTLVLENFMSYIFGIMKADKKIIVYIFLKPHQWSNGWRAIDRGFHAQIRSNQRL